MAFFTKQQVQRAIKGGESQGFSGDDVVNELVTQGHQLEGLNAEERRTPGAFPIEQNTGGISQVGKQLYNVGNEALQFTKALGKDPGGFVGALGGLAVGAAERGIEESSKAISDIGGVFGLDIPTISIPTFHPDGTVTHEEDTPEEQSFKGMANVIGKQYGVESVLKGDLPQAGRDISKTLFEAPLTSALDVMGARVVKAGELPKISKVKMGKIPKLGGDVRPGMIKTAAKGMGDEMLQKTTGLGKENIETIVRNPKLYAKADAGEITRGSLANNVKSSIDTRLKEIGESGRVYEDIRRSGEVVKIENKGVQSVLKEYGLEFDIENNRIKVGSESRPLSGSDIRELEEFFSQYGGEDLTSNGFLNAREKLSQLSGFDATRTDVMNNLARELRSHYNKIGRPQISGLKELDNKYAPEVGKLRDIKKEYLRTVVDENGARVTILKDNAISRIMGSTNKGRDEVLKRLDDISPGIGDEIRVLKALEDVQLATGNKIGTYFRSGLGVLGASTAFGPAGVVGAIPIIATAILTSPSVIARILEWYGNSKGYGIAPDVMLNMKRTGKLAPDEKLFVQEAIQAYEKASDTKIPRSPQSANQLGSKGEGLSTSAENRTIGLTGSKGGSAADDLVDRSLTKPSKGGKTGGDIKVFEDLGFSNTEDIIPLKLNGKTVGGIEATPHRGDIETLRVHNIRILQEAQRKGLGKEAINKLFEENPNVKQVIGNSLDESRPFWEKVGAEFSSGETTAFTIKRPNSSKIPKEMEGLAKEARKYDSAEEFVSNSHVDSLGSAQTGKPLKAKLYHGSPDARFAEEFDANKLGQFKDAPELLPDNTGFIDLYGGINKGFAGESVTGNKGVSFTDSRATAQSYANKPAFDNQNSIPMVLERYVELKNPKVYDLKGEKWNLKMEVEMRKAIEDGHDGLVFNNILDNYHPFESNVPANNIIVLDTNAIKTKSQLTDIYNQAHGK